MRSISDAMAALSGSLAKDLYRWHPSVSDIVKYRDCEYVIVSIKRLFLGLDAILNPPEPQASIRLKMLHTAHDRFVSVREDQVEFSCYAEEY